MADKQNAYQTITDTIVKMLDEGTVPWRMGWKRRGLSIPLNAWNRPYRGINVFILAFVAQSKGYTSRYWMTFKQAQERGGRVREGERGARVVFWKPIRVEDKTTKQGFKTIPILRDFVVFNLDQTENVKLTKKQADDLAAVTAEGTFHEGVNEDAEAIIGTYFAMEGAPAYFEDGRDACYIPLLDEIHVPERSQFEDLNQFYATVNHEITHSTGHSSRLARKEAGQVNHFGDDKYAFEELVAELGGAYLNAEAGVTNTLENSAAYIAHWSARFKADNTLIVKAASAAQKAADYILGTTFEKEVEV